MGEAFEKTNAMTLEEKYAIEPIPEEHRVSWLKTATLYSGMCASIALIMVGGGLMGGLSFIDTLIATLAGILALILFIYMPMGIIGMEQGVNTYIIGESAFGEKGSNIATALIVTAIPCIAWYGIQVTIASDAIARVFEIGSTGASFITAVLGILFVIPTIYGTKSMVWLNYLSIPIRVFIVGYGIYKAINILGDVAIIRNYTPPQRMDIMWGINTVIGAIIVGAAFVADYTRWEKNNLGGLAASGIVGIYPFSLLFIFTGMIMALAAIGMNVTDYWNPVSLMIAIGMPSIVLVFIFLLQWTACVISIYSSSLALVKVFGGKKWVWSFVSAIIGTSLAIFGIVNRFMSVLSFLATFVSPVIGVIIAEYFFVSRRKINKKKGFYWPGLLSWLVGGAAGLKTTFFIPALNGLLLSCIIYTVYHAVFAKKGNA